MKTHVWNEAQMMFNELVEERKADFAYVEEELCMYDRVCYGNQGHTATQAQAGPAHLDITVLVLYVKQNRPPSLFNNRGQ